jgi:hypothetical protein
MQRSSAATHGSVSDCMTYRLVTAGLESAEASTSSRRMTLDSPRDRSGRLVPQRQ